MSFTGSPLWDLFGDSVDSLLNTYNKSIRLMWNIPLQSHRYLLEIISGKAHLKFELMRRFLNFESQIFKTSKTVVQALYTICKTDCGSTTGRNFRKIMLSCDKNSVFSLSSSDIDCLQYFPVPEHEKWKIPVLEELLETRKDFTELQGFSSEDITSMIDYLCVS